MNIAIQEFKANLLALILWCVSLITLIFLVSFEFEIFQGNLEIQEFMDSPLFQQFYAALGAGNVNIMTPEGFLSLLSIYIYLPLAIHAGLLGAGIISKEEKNKTAEYLFTLPISRINVLIQKFFAGFVYILLANIFVLGSAMVIFGRFETSDMYYQFIRNLSIGVFITQLIFYSIGVGLASTLRDYKKSGSITVGALLTTYMLSVLSNMADESNFLRFFTPFRYFAAPEMVENEFSFIYILLSLILIGIGTSSLFYFYPKRDLYI
jgi:ABC-2 type transport system permease protein